MNSRPTSRKKPRFLVFGRNFLVPDFRKTFDPVSDHFDFTYITDGRSKLAQSIRPTFYQALKQGHASPALSSDDVEDIVSRCRLLRNISRIQAERLVHAMAFALEAALENAEPNAVISQMVDEYTTHVFQILAAKRNIGYLSYCAGYFPGTSLLLADSHGRPFNWRMPAKTEVDAQLDRVSGVDFRQTYNLGAGYSLFTHLKYMLRYRIKKVYFPLRALIERDPWNLHYRVADYIAERRRLSDYPADKLFCRDWKAQIRVLRAERPDAKIIYMPLSYFPESTIDYWVLNRAMIDYADKIVEIVQTLSKHHIVVIKEHLHMMGARNIEFLRTIRDLRNVVSVHPMALSNQVVAESDVVLLGSGSPGIEATLRGKPVASFCDTSYWFRPSKATFLDLEQIANWPDRLVQAIEDFVPPSSEATADIIAKCMASSTRTEPVKSIWPILSPQDVVPLLRRLSSREAI